MLNLPGPSTGAIAAGTKTVECTSLGTHIRNTKRFLVLNPRHGARSGGRRCLGGAAPPPVPAFRCLTPEGVIAPGKRYDMVSSLSPRWRAPARCSSTLKSTSRASGVLPVRGHGGEPAVQFEVSSSISQGSHGTNREIMALSNHENTPFAFNFDQSSWVLPDGSNPRALTFEPYVRTVSRTVSH